MMPDRIPAVSVVVPNWNGRAWLPQCLDALTAQTVGALEVIVVDNGSSDGSREYLRARHPDVRVIAVGFNSGFAHAANRGLRAARGEFVALVNTDVVLASDWVQRTARALAADPGAASVACKMLSLDNPAIVYDAGDVLRRDGSCRQRGRFRPDDGRWETPGEVFGACAGAALYRRDVALIAGGFDERFFAYLEDVDLALRLRLGGWSCRYEPAVAMHAGEGSSRQLPGGHHRLVERNTLLLVAKTFPARWTALVAYRQLSWAWHALRERRLRSHLRGATAALPLLPRALRERRALSAAASVKVHQVVPAMRIRSRHERAAAKHAKSTARAR
jgi:GT2 family glycosyltransferase